MTARPGSECRSLSVASFAQNSTADERIIPTALPIKQELLDQLEKRLIDCQLEWTDRLGKAAERLQDSTKETKRALFELESEREKTARLANEVEELKLEVETIKMTSASREKFFQKEVEDYRGKLRKKEAEVGQIRESTSSDLSELGEKCRKLVATLDEKQQLVSSLTDQLKNLRDEKTRVETQMESVTKERERAEKYSSDLERRNEELVARESQLEVKCRQMEDDLNDFRAEINRRDRTINELEDAVLAAKRASAEVAMSSGERDRALSHLLEENGKLQSKLEEALMKVAKNSERLRDARQQLNEKEAQLSDVTREVETQREYCRTMKIDLERARQQREAAYAEHEHLAKQLIEFRALPICQQQLPTVSNNDFQSLKMVIPFIREKLELHERLIHDLHQIKIEMSAAVEQKKDLLKTCKDKDSVINECRASLEQALGEIERLRGTVMEADRKQEAATMRAARLTEQLHREQADHERTLSLMKAAEAEANSAEQRWAKLLYRFLGTLMGQRSGQPQSIPQGLKTPQLVPLVQKEMAALHAATARCFEKYHEMEAELSSARNQLGQRDAELRRIRVESEGKLSEYRCQLEHEKSTSSQRIEIVENRLRSELTTLETKLQDVMRDRDELRSQIIHVDTSKVDMETRLSQTLSALDYCRNENRLLAAAGGVLLASLVNTLRRLSALIMGCAVLRIQVAASDVFRLQLQNLLNSLASTAGLSTEKTSFSSSKPVGIFAFRKAAIAVLAANRLRKFTNHDESQSRRTLVVLPAGSCRQINCTVGMDMLAGEGNGSCDALSFVCWLGGEDFAKRFLALGSLLTLPESSSSLFPGDDRLQSALRSSLRCVLTSAVELFDPPLCPSPNRPHAGSKRECLLTMLASGLRQAFSRHRAITRQQRSNEDSLSPTLSQSDLPVYSFQVIFDSICSYWQRLTDQLVSGWQQQRTRLMSDLSDAQRQLAIVKPDVETLRKQLEMSVPRPELESAWGELSSALDREKTLQVAVADQAKQLQRLLDETNSFASQHSSDIATIAAKNAELATVENRLAELVEANEHLQAAAAEAEQVVSVAASDRRWTCDYVRQVEALAVRWASKLSRLYTDQVEFRQFYGQLHGLGAHLPGGALTGPAHNGRQSTALSAKGALGNNAYHASQACVRLTRTFLHLFDHARKYAQSMADCSMSAIDFGNNIGVDELATLMSGGSKMQSAASLSTLKRSPRSKQRSRMSSSRTSKSVNSTPRDILINANIMN